MHAGGLDKAQFGHIRRVAQGIGGARAGVTVIAPPVGGLPQTWFVAGWGVVTVGPFRTSGRSLEPGEGFVTRYTVILHDDDIADDDIAAAGHWMESA